MILIAAIMNGSPGTSSNGSPSNHSFGYGAPALNLGPAIPLNIPYAKFVSAPARQLEADLKPMGVPKQSPSSTSSQAAAAAADNKKKKRKFPHKLYDMLEHASNYPEWSSAVSWSNNGKSFSINNRDKLIDLLPTFFQQTKFRSFVSSYFVLGTPIAFWLCTH